MEEALTPDECAKMKAFLRTLVAYANCLPPGSRPDVSGFLSVWNRLAGGTGKRYKRGPAGIIEKAVKLKMEGLRVADIARRLGVDQGTVGKWVRQKGLYTRKRRDDL
jgi:hypothetical protein